MKIYSQKMWKEKVDKGLKSFYLKKNHEVVHNQQRIIMSGKQTGRRMVKMTYYFLCLVAADPGCLLTEFVVFEMKI